MTDIFETIVAWRREGRRAALATIVTARGSIPSFQSAKMLVGEDGSQIGTVGGGCVEADVWQAAREVIEVGVPRTLTFNLNKDPKYDAGLVCGGTLEVFVEPLWPSPALHIFGAGHVGHAVYRVATMAGFEVVVADDREAFANRERFPEAREVLVDELEQICARITPTKASFLFIATRGHHDDMRVLRWAVGTPAHYIGMVGSRRKVSTICRVLDEAGLLGDALERVHAPVGLEIGATTPEEIAISVVAELIAIRRSASAALPHMRWLGKSAQKAAAAPASEAEASAS
jgi:xanthine dehydrogenase accessory factor